MERFFIQADGRDAEAERAGVAWLAGEAARRGTSGAIIVPGLDSVRNLGRAIGPDAVAFAEKNRYFAIQGHMHRGVQ